MQFINVQIINENGEKVDEWGKNFVPILDVILSNSDLREKMMWLETIDPYGNTYFNLYQTPHLISELRELKVGNNQVQLVELIDSLIPFIETVEQHIYLLFVGD